MIYLRIIVKYKPEFVSSDLLIHFYTKDFCHISTVLLIFTHFLLVIVIQSLCTFSVSLHCIRNFFLFSSPTARLWNPTIIFN